MIYQAKTKAVVMDAHRWAFIQEGDQKIKWINRFTKMAEALGELGYYQTDGNKNLIRDAKGLPVFDHNWKEKVQIHSDIEQLKNDLGFWFEL
jgi:hypothetical protein